VIEQAVRDSCILGDVADPCAVVAVFGEHADRSFEDPLPLVPSGD
jgi:hypothetical protein